MFIQPRLVAVLLIFAGACATPAPRRQASDTYDSRAKPGRPRLEPGVETKETPREATAPFREELEKATTAAARREIGKRAVQAALDAGQPTEAVTWLLRAIREERDPNARRALEEDVLDLVDTEVPPLGIRSLLEEVRPRTFPHEHLQFKLALLQLHAGDTAAARDSFTAYLKDYRSGLYARRAQQRLDRLAALERVQPDAVGVLLPLSGPKERFGQQALQAVKLAFDRSSIRLIVRDSGDDEATVAAAVESLVYEEGVIAILGPVFRTEARAAAATAHGSAVPLLTITAAEDVSSYGPWVFRNGVTNRAQAQALVEHAMKVLGLNSFAILYPRHPYGLELRDLFWKEVVKQGGSIKGVQSYREGQTTFSKPVKRLVGRFDPARRPDYRKGLLDCENQPDSYRRARCRKEVGKDLKPIVDFEGLFIPDFAANIRMIAAALAAEDIIVEQDPRRLRIIERTLGRTPKIVTLLGASGWNFEKITDSTGRTVENAVFTDGFFARADEERTARFVRAYRERFNRVPRNYPEALIYDSARIFRSVIERQKPSTRLEFRDALLAVSNFEGVTGLTSFRGRTDAQKRLKILTITDGEIVEVPPPDKMPPPSISAPGGGTGASSP